MSKENRKTPPSTQTVSSSSLKMHEHHICFFNNKESLVIKTPKKSPLMLRMVALVIAMVCGVYVFSTSLTQVLLAPQKLPSKLTIVVDHPVLKPIDQQQCPSPPPSSSSSSSSSSSAADQQPDQSHHLHYPKPTTYSRKECVCNPVRMFAIVSMQRSGSGWFETLLNSHVNVSSNGEIFGERDRRCNASRIYETLDRIYRLDWVSSASKNECTAAFGFKWMLNQGLMQFHQPIAEYFNRRGVSAIFLFRRNILRRRISLLANSYDKEARLLNGTHKSHTHSAQEAQILASYKPRMDIKILKSNMRKEEQMMAKVLEYFNTTRHIVLFYEDIVGNRTKLEEVQDFLTLPKRNLTSGQVKIHNGHLSKQIENWDEVKEALQGTQFEKFLQADYRR